MSDAEDRGDTFRLGGSVDWVPRKGKVLSVKRDAWGSVVLVAGVFALVAAVAVTLGAVGDYQRVEPISAELKGIRGVLLAILGGKMISWAQKRSRL